MTCPGCDSDSIATLSSQVCGTVTVRRRQCKACACEWLAKVTEEVMAIQKRPVLSKSGQSCLALANPGQSWPNSSAQLSVSDLDLNSGSPSADPEANPDQTQTR